MIIHSYIVSFIRVKNDTTSQCYSTEEAISDSCPDAPDDPQDPHALRAPRAVLLDECTLVSA